MSLDGTQKSFLAVLYLLHQTTHIFCTRQHSGVRAEAGLQCRGEGKSSTSLVEKEQQGVCSQTALDWNPATDHLTSLNPFLQL